MPNNDQWKELPAPPENPVEQGIIVPTPPEDKVN